MSKSSVCLSALLLSGSPLVPGHSHLGPAPASAPVHAPSTLPLRPPPQPV